MLDLDFAFFNMREDNRQGLANRNTILDRLVPFLFPPRVEHLINFARLGFKGCNVMLPLGEGNWNLMNQDNRGRIIEKTAAILNEYELSRMGVDRRLKGIFSAQEHRLPINFGDKFISVLAAVLIEKAISRHDIQKLVLVGNVPYLESLLRNLSAYKIPLSIQNYQPVRYEIMVYRLLYEEGVAVSNSCLNPQNWRRGDLIIYFDTGLSSMTLASPQAFYLRLDDDQSGLAPELEKVLAGAGLNPQLHTLAPILETCLLAKAGKINSDGEEKHSEMSNGTPKIHQEMVAAGHDLGLWEPFLDKGL